MRAETVRVIENDPFSIEVPTRPAAQHRAAANVSPQPPAACIVPYPLKAETPPPLQRNVQLCSPAC